MTPNEFTQALDALWDAKVADLPPWVQDSWRGMDEVGRGFGLNQVSGSFPSTVKPRRIRFELLPGRILVTTGDLLDRELENMEDVDKAMQAFVDAFVNDCEKHLSDS
ncbi:MAG TPA: hypothetical protein VG796_22070 [Verrucomicrobiales bacterium]|jgi:hypothetical protein|nr:hypothetical protein [Verrucomicrobiales bacterium]